MKGLEVGSLCLSFVVVLCVWCFGLCVCSKPVIKHKQELVKKNCPFIGLRLDLGY